MTQLEDPRLEWLSIQEAMLRDYLHTAQEALEVSYKQVTKPKQNYKSPYLIKRFFSISIKVGLLYYAIDDYEYIDCGNLESYEMTCF